METVFIYSVISLFIGGIMWSFEGSKFTDHGQNMSMLLFFKFSKWFFVILGFAIPIACLLYTSPSPRDAHESRMPSSA